MLNLEKKRKKKILSRYTALFMFILFIIGTIGYQLYSLQVVQGAENSQKASTNSIKDIPIDAPRGNITDKNGVILANNKQSYNVTFMESNYSDNKTNNFYSTMNKVFQTMDENRETQNDTFPLKVNPYRFEFNTSDPNVIKTLQLRFLKDRGVQSLILKQDFKNKAESTLTTAEENKLNEELLSLSPETVYNYLMTSYGIDKGLKTVDPNYSVAESRRYMLVKDAIKMQSFTGYQPIDIYSNISYNSYLIMMQKMSQLPGINVDIQPLRQYPYGSLASPVIGYISKISSSYQEKYQEKGYDTSTEYIGASGMEAAMEKWLHGENGEQVVQVDKQGNTTKNLSTKPAQQGDNIQLTIDANVQYAAEQGLSNELKQLQATGNIQGNMNISNATRGAAVVVDVHTGGILALVSLPDFNPNDFSNPNGLTDAEINKYFNTDYESMAKAKGMSQSLIDFMFPVDTSIKGNTTKRVDKYDYFPKPLYNYATMSLVPSGSTFKPVVAVAGLQTGVINSSFTIYDSGSFNDGKGFTDEFLSDGAHGITNIVKAITVSSNPFFMTVAQLLKDKFGPNEIAKYAWLFGLGADPNGPSSAASTGIEIPENFGQVYNSTSQKNVDAAQFLLNAERDLSTGIALDGTKMPVVDISDNANDSQDVASIKTQIKTEFQNAIKNYTSTKNETPTNFAPLLKQLFSKDPKYKGQSISEAQINLISSDMNTEINRAIDDMNLPYHTYVAAIGQGMDAFTPLQMAGYVATLANGGNRMKLHLLDKVTDANGNVVEQVQPEVLDKVDMSSTTQQLVMEGMNGVTSSSQGGAEGTAAAELGPFSQYIQTAGKTGTAEFNTADIQNKIGRTDYAWFIGYAPATNPQIAVSVVMFDGGYGEYSANVARDIYEAYFKTELQQKGFKFDINVNAQPEN